MSEETEGPSKDEVFALATAVRATNIALMAAMQAQRAAALAALATFQDKDDEALTGYKEVLDRLREAGTYIKESNGLLEKISI